MLGVLLLAGGYVAGQETSPSQKARANFQLVLQNAEAGTGLFGSDAEQFAKYSNSSTEIAELYKRAAGNNDLTKAAMTATARQYYGAKLSTQSAVQVAQIADEASVRLQLLQTAQNQRIIGLLEKIAAKK